MHLHRFARIAAISGIVLCAALVIMTVASAVFGSPSFV